MECSNVKKFKNPLFNIDLHSDFRRNASADKAKKKVAFAEPEESIDLEKWTESSSEPSAY